MAMGGEKIWQDRVGAIIAGIVPRMLCSAPHLLRSDALLIRGPSMWVPVLRRIVKNAAPRPGHGAIS
jgi:hypothetical protein